MHLSALRTWPEFLVVIVVVLIGVRLVFKLAITKEDRQHRECRIQVQ